MNSFSIDRSGPLGTPSWITLDTLLQVLAVDAAGPELKTEAFGSLLAAILENEAQPQSDTYTIQDLAWLLDVEERCADLPEESVIECGKIITRARLSGKNSNDPELQLEIQRAFQGDRLELVKEANTVKADLSATRIDLDSEQTKANRLRDSLITERTGALKRAAILNFAWKAFAGVLVGSASITLGYWLAVISDSDNSAFRVIGTVLLSAGVLSVTPWLIKQAIQLVGSLRSVEAQAQSQVADLELEPQRKVDSVKQFVD